MRMSQVIFDSVRLVSRERPIQVGFLIDRLLPGGTELQLLALIRHLDRERVKPFLVLLDGEDELSRSLEPSDVPLLRLGVRRLKSVHALRQAWRLRRFLRSEKIEVLQLYSHRDSPLVAQHRCTAGSENHSAIDQT